MSRTRSVRPRVVLIFGEDPNDTEAIAALLQALRPDVPTPRTRRRPLVLVKGREEARQRNNAAAIARVVRAAGVLEDVRMVIAHQDCDAIEPAHEELSAQIEARLAAEGLSVVAATPAWEMEGWWFLWPEAVQAINPTWRRPTPPRQRVGLIANAKETLGRVLVAGVRGRRTRPYRESDAPNIARQVRDRGLVDQRAARSDSFDRFAERVREAAF